MATFRSKPLIQIHRLPTAVVVAALVSLACMSREGSSAAAPIGEAKLQKIEIEHVIPRRDAVGPQPTRLEWTVANGIDSYAISVENEIEIQIFEQENIETTSVPWPKEIKLEPGTYFWRIVGLKGGRVIADSGRAAFVVLER
jgi:hypothetical protein